MKTKIIEALKQLIVDRYLLALLSIMVIISIVASVIIGLSIHPSEVQLISHYSAYGVTNTYRDQWIYLFVFVLFEIIVMVLHFIISLKLLVVKNHTFAIMFAWAGIGIILIGWVTSFAVINVWTHL